MHLYFVRLDFVGLDVHKQVIAYCVKTAGGDIVMEGKIPATRSALDQWVGTLPGPGTAGWKRPCSADFPALAAACWMRGRWPICCVPTCFRPAS